MFIWMPSWAAGPLNAADWPNSIVVGVTPGACANEGPTAAQAATNVANRLIFILPLHLDDSCMPNGSNFRAACIGHNGPPSRAVAVGACSRTAAGSGYSKAFRLGSILLADASGLAGAGAPGRRSFGEELLHLRHPRFRARIVAVAVLLAERLELAQQLLLPLREIDRRLDHHVAQQVAVLAAAHALDALAPQPEDL